MDTGLRLRILENKLRLAAFLRHGIVRVHSDRSVGIPVGGHADPEHSIVRPVNHDLRPGQNQDGAKRYRARMQFYGGEDPATGSAAGCAIGYLVGHGLTPEGERIHLRQGIEIGRPSDIFVSAKREVNGITDVRVGGSTVLVARGQLLVA